MGNRRKNKLNFKSVNTPGRLITFCGLDGSGKTSMINLLNGYLNNLGVSTMLTKQPTEFIRQNDMFRNFIDKPDHTGYDFTALTLLAAGDRVQHSNNIIYPAMERGITVISDRYFYSCLANYRAYGCCDDWIYKIAEYIPKPDAAFFLDAEVNTAVSRVRERREERDRYIDIGFQQRLREEYLKIAEENGGIIIPADFNLEEAFGKVVSEIRQGDN